MPLTTTVTWQDLIHHYDDELADLSDAYTELQTLANDEYGDDALSNPPTDQQQQAIQQQAQRYEEAVETIQKRQHVLEQLREEYGAGDFEIKMLSGSETMDIETELRMEAQQRGVDVDVIQTKRNALTVDAATVDAPEDVPTDDDGSPVPSECPNALTLSLWELVELYNNSGSVDFQPEGVGNSDAATPPTVASPTPSTSDKSSTESDMAKSNDEPQPHSG